MSLKLAFILEAVDRATAKVQAVNRTVDKLNEPAARVKASFTALANEAGLEKLKTQFGAINDRAASLIGTVRGVVVGFAAMTAAAGAVFFGLKRTIDQIDDLNDQAQMLGIAVDQLDRLGHAAQLSGSNAEEMGNSLRFLQDHIAKAREGSKESVEMFGRLGISMEELPSLTVAQVLDRMADTFERVGNYGQNAAKKIDTAKGLMGRGGARMIQLLNGGSKNIKELADEADRLGTVTPGAASKIGAFNDSYDRMLRSIRGVTMEIISSALPAFDAMVKKFTDMNVANRAEWGAKIGKVIGDIVTRLPGFLSAVGQISVAIATVVMWSDRAAQAMGGWQNVMYAIAAILGSVVVVKLVALGVAVAGAVKTLMGMYAAARIFMIPVLVDLGLMLAAVTIAFLSTPLGWFVLAAVAVAGAATLIVSKWEPIKTFFIDLWESIGRVIDRATNWIGLGGTGPSISNGNPMGDTLADSMPGPAAPSLGGPGAQQRTPWGGKLEIKIDAEGRARVQGMQSSSRDLDMDVYSGMHGALN